MRFKLALLLAAFVLSLPGQTPGAERALKAARYTIQVASFPNPAEAGQLVARLAGLGERVTSSVVDLMGRGSWTRVLVGTFATVAEARSRRAPAEPRGYKGVLYKSLLLTRLYSPRSRVITFFGSNGTNILICAEENTHSGFGKRS